MPSADPPSDRSHTPGPRIPAHAYYAAAAAVVLVVALRPPPGPVIVQGRDIGSVGAQLEAYLPSNEPRAAVRTVPESERAGYKPGYSAPAAGFYRPVGKLRQRRRGQPVATHLVVYETHFEVGDVFPELTGYEPGAVWVRESER